MSLATSRRLRAFCLLAASFSCLWSSGVAAQAYGLNERTSEWVDQASRIAPASLDTAFGDDVSLYNQATTFNATDISLSGTGPAVELRRKFEVRDHRYDEDTFTTYSNGHRGELGDWDLDLPEISGVFEATGGWRVSGSSPYARCSSRTGPIPTSVFQGSDYWDGNELHVPGQTSEQLLLNPTSGGKRPLPSDGTSYPWTTKSGWMIGCTPATANGYPGEGFVATSPDGTRYYLDWVVKRSYPGLVGYQIQSPLTGRWADAKIDRNKIYFLVSKVVDRFNNTVDYHYSGDLLSSITASDGRKITLAYANGLLASAVAGSQVYRYAYADGFLSTATRPDASTWTYAHTGDLVIQHNEELNTQTDTCHVVPASGVNFVYTIVNPAGLKGVYTFSVRRHIKQNVPELCVTWLSDNYPGTPSLVRFWRITLYSDSYSLARKDISGPGVESATWTYSQKPANLGRHGFQADCEADPGSCPLTTAVVVYGPGTYERYTFGIWWGLNDGQLLKKEKGSDSDHILSTQDYSYVSEAEAAQLPFGNAFGWDWQAYHDRLTSANRPLRSAVTTLQGETFTSHALAYDNFARPTSTQVSSSLGYSKTETTTYFDQLSDWVIGQPRERICTAPTTGCAGIVESKTDYDPATALPIRIYSPGKPVGKIVQSLTYNNNGTVATVKDGNGHVTSVSNWKRGIPQNILYADGTTQSAVVDDNGWIGSVTDDLGNKTCYAYDSMGRVSRITYPSETQTGVCDTSAWNATSISFAPVPFAQYAIPAGHWTRTESTGNSRKVTYFDALWRPLVQEQYDAANSAATRSIVVTRYDAAGRQAFQSYPASALGSAGYENANVKGSYTTYDALDRVQTIAQDSKYGPLTTVYAYLDGFRTQVTNPRGFSTTTRFMAYDQPGTDWPVHIEAPEGAVTDIDRDPSGKPTAITRGNASGSVAETRSYTYDGYQQLCRTVEPETGATLQGFDDAGNLAWSASGLPSGTACDAQGDTAAILARRVDRTYDARNRVVSLSFPDQQGDTSYNYEPDGLVSTVTASNPGNNQVTTTYSYNHRRMMSLERMQWNTINWTIAYAFDSNGHLSKQTNPGNFPVYFAPNALGQPTQAGGYATGVTYYPNGAIHQFTYGNGIVHTMTQNLRQLPDTSLDVDGAKPVLWDGYDYDANGNVAAISDGLPDVSGNRSMTYDGLDRLTDVNAPALYDTVGAHYSYDVIDNLTHVNIGGTDARDQYYCYDATWRLKFLRSGPVCTGSGASPAKMMLDYDVQGNLKNKNSQVFAFDYGNRLRTVTSSPNSAYVYDGQGRRVRDATSVASKYSLYSTSGQLVYTSDGRQHVQSWYVYLGGSLVGIRERDTGTGVVSYKYQHTDALGSPVTVTDANGAVVEHNEYEPFGKVLNHPLEDGPGYTGHVMDAATGMNYMQQRYYDPAIGRFLSVDPVTADGNSGLNFNRYWYANNNPYRFTDPDGREVRATYDIRTGTLVVVDVDSGNMIQVKAESGGNPFGDPIEVGTYDILDHPDQDFLRLERIDGDYGDDTTPSGRDEFRLHRPGHTWGCIAVCTSKEWAQVRKSIRGTSTSTVRVKSKSWNPFAPKTEQLKRFGKIRVIRSKPPAPPKSMPKPQPRIPRGHE